MFLKKLSFLLILFLYLLKSLGLAFEVIDLNSATIEDIIKIPGIGKVTAKNIIEYREKNGPFNSLEDLLKVKGIGPKKLEQIKPYVTLNKVSFNSSYNPFKSSFSIYFYKDEKGIIHYTQFPENVPLKYRNSLKKLE